MRNILATLLRATLLLIVSVGTLGGLRAQEKPSGFRDLPVRKEIHKQYQLAPNAAVEISLIAGPVEIETTTDQSAEINIVISAETQADLDCSDMTIEHAPEKLVIRSKSLCNNVTANQRVLLKLPRNVNLDLKNIAGHVRIGPTEGMVRLNSIAGHVKTGQLQAVEMTSLARGLSMGVSQIGERGMRLRSITGGIELGISDSLNAQFVANSVIGNVVSDTPTIKIVNNGRSDYEALIGSGGRRISISSVVGGIRLHKLSD